MQFLKDLVKLEKLGGLPTAKIVTLPEAMTLSEVRVSAPRVSVDELVIVEIPEQLPVKTVLIEHDAVTGETTERIVDAVQGEGLVFEPMRDFREAALCMVSAPDADGVYDADCQTFKDDMEPGDYVTFAGNGAMDTTVLTEDSVGVKTKDFLHQKVIADGVQKLSLHPAVLPAASLMP